MDKPETIEDYVSKIHDSSILLRRCNPTDKETLLQFVKDCINVNDTYNSYMRDKVCAVCGKKLTDHELKLQSPTWCHSVCMKHEFFASMFLIKLAKERHPDKI